MKKVKISAVSYLNTLPFIYGIEQNHSLSETIDLSKDIPSECARKLVDNEVDLGLIPVATIQDLDYSEIHTNYCIGAIGRVSSVLLVSDVPLNEIKYIYLDYQSRTSVKLCQILCNRYWNIDVIFLPSEVGYEKKIKGTTAGVIIGDRTFNLHKKFNYSFDLSEQWMNWKELPFVFAAWVSNKKLPTNFIRQFNEALKFGIEHKKASLTTDTHSSLSSSAQEEYIEKYISYELDSKKKKSLEIFLTEIKMLKTAV